MSCSFFRLPFSFTSVSLTTLSEEENLKMDAKIAYEKYIKFSPNNISVRKKLFKFYIEDKEYNKALITGEKILSYSNSHEEILIKMSYVYNKEGMHEKAIDLCRQLLKKHPYEIKLWRNLIKALYNKGEYRKTTQACNKALKIDKNSVYAIHYLGLAYHNLGYRANLGYR